MLGDKAYDADPIRQHNEDEDTVPIIPDSGNRNQLHAFNPTLYHLCNHFECFFNKIKDFQRIATRNEKLTANYRAMVQLAATRIRLRINEATI